MSRTKVQKQKGGSKKHGRNKRAKSRADSLFAKGKISFQQYEKMKRAK